MHSLNRIAKSFTNPSINPIQSKYVKSQLNPTILLKSLSTKPPQNHKDDSWNDAWETAWLPDDVSPKNRAPWEAEVNFTSSADSTKLALSPDVDAETKAFVEDMNENWNERRKSPQAEAEEEAEKEGKGMAVGLYSLENIRKIIGKEQRIHAGLWMKEIASWKKLNWGIQLMISIDA
ncbi:putative Protein HVA22 [Hibiscus syriacus]|uniref:Uncharacterized protein n=1 Tax=Hibiscus syriacus TaxID=106335 RepID=A0A6A3BT11_HIBSY|nr:putative Protein HVA22 [Hibiscus syriacus]